MRGFGSWSQSCRPIKLQRQDNVDAGLRRVEDLMFQMFTFACINIAFVACFLFVQILLPSKYNSSLNKASIAMIGMLKSSGYSNHSFQISKQKLLLERVTKTFSPFLYHDFSDLTDRILICMYLKM